MLEKNKSRFVKIQVNYMRIKDYIIGRRKRELSKKIHNLNLGEWENFRFYV
jgi:hypothetical protein